MKIHNFCIGVVDSPYPVWPEPDGYDLPTNPYAPT